MWGVRKLKKFGRNMMDQMPQTDKEGNWINLYSEFGNALVKEIAIRYPYTRDNMAGDLGYNMTHRLFVDCCSGTFSSATGGIKA